IQEAFQDQKPLNEQELALALMSLFDGLAEAIARKDADQVAGYFNFARLLEEIEGLGMLPKEMFQNRPAAATDLGKGLSQALAGSTLLKWNSSEVKHLKKLPGGEAIAIVLHRDAQGNFLRMRWWVTNRTGSWRVFDLEDLSTGL